MNTRRRQFLMSSAAAGSVVVLPLELTASEIRGRDVDCVIFDEVQDFDNTPPAEFRIDKKLLSPTIPEKLFNTWRAEP